MSVEKKVTQLLYEVIDDLNRDLPEQMRLEKSNDAELFGESGHVDSMLLVNLIISMEQKIDQELGIAIALGDEKAMSQSPSPFSTVGSLVNFISQSLHEENET